jgi:hypothetical protein
MVRVDIICDLMDEDETGHVGAFLRDARDPALIRPVPSSWPVTRMRQPSPKSSKPAGRIVHLRILPGQLEDYQAVIQRAVIRA